MGPIGLKPEELCIKKGIFVMGIGAQMRKGISPIVAVVLLIAIAVIAAVGLYFWVGGIATKQPTTNVPTAISATVLDAATGTIAIANLGSSDLVVEYLNTTSGETCDFGGEVTIAPNEQAVCTMPPRNGATIIYGPATGQANVILPIGEGVVFQTDDFDSWEFFLDDFSGGDYDFNTTEGSVILTGHGAPYDTPGNYTSELFDSESDYTNWTSFSWTEGGFYPMGTSIMMYVNVSNATEPGDWVAISSGNPVGAIGRYLQFRAVLETSNPINPELVDVTTDYYHQYGTFIYTVNSETAFTWVAVNRTCDDTGEETVGLDDVSGHFFSVTVGVRTDCDYEVYTDGFEDTYTLQRAYP